MKLGDRTPYDLDRLDLSYMKNDGNFSMADLEAARRMMGEKLSHLDLVRTLADGSVKCHCDSWFRPVSQAEAAIRLARSGEEYCCVPEPHGRTFDMDMRRIRTMIFAGRLAGFLEDYFRSAGIRAAFEARADLNRFYSMAALYPDGRIGLFFDVSPYMIGGRTAGEAEACMLAPVDDMSAVCLGMSMLHLARHAVQLDMFHRDACPDGVYSGMRERFLAGCADPAYYMASYQENLMDLEAEMDAALSMREILARHWPAADAEALLLDYFNYKLMWHNTENLIFPARDGTLPDFGTALAGLTVKLFKTAEWYRTDPRHDRELDPELARKWGWDRPGGR